MKSLARIYFWNLRDDGNPRVPLNPLPLANPLELPSSAIIQEQAFAHIFAT